MRRVAIGAGVLTAALVAAVLAVVVVGTEQTLRRTHNESERSGQAEFDLGPLTLSNPGFFELAAPNSYTAGVLFEGNTVLAGPGGLTIVAPGKPNVRQLLPGLELPPVAITSLAVGRLRGESRPQLIAATGGEGLLFLSDLDGGAIRQLRPREAALRDVTAVLLLASGELLVGTRGKGLLTFDGATLAPFNAALADIPVTALAGDAAEFWVGTRDRGVFHFHAGQLDGFGRDSGLPDRQVESIALSEGRAFVGTPLGVAEFDDGKPSRVLAKGVFAHALEVDGDNLEIATVDQGIVTVALSGAVDSHGSIRADSSGQFDATGAMREDGFFAGEDGLFGVGANGVVRRERGGGWAPVQLERSSRQEPVLADRNIAALSFAPDGRLWIGYFDRGLDVVNLATDESRHFEDDHVFCVNRIVADPVRDTMDVATANGLVLFDPAGRERQVLMRRDGLIADQVTDIAFAGKGTVLATPAGLTFIDASGVSSLYGFQGLVNNHVYALATDAASDTLLAGTLGGISVLGGTALLRDAAVRRNLSASNSGLKQNWITALVPVAESSEADGTDHGPDHGRGWFVGTYGAGVLRLNEQGQFTAMEMPASHAVINFNAMLVTPRHVFAGSLGDGLLVYDRPSQRWSKTTAGLPSLNVTALAEHDGELYVGTENGVAHIAEARLMP